MTNSCSYDALNQQEQCNTFWYTYDAVGNRTTRKNKSTSAIHTYTWDELNRLTAWTASNSWTYAYRSDGMRVSKARNNSATIFRYDGQTGIQDVEFSTNSLTWLSTTDYAVGARGIDATSVTNSSGVAISYPIYDAHGNGVAMLSKNGTTYSLANQRAYDAWGGIRQGSSSGSPNGRHVANLGHKQDDESGLIYMRARYYEPARGRFISEDPDQERLNWYAYCSNDPVNRADISGKEDNLFAQFLKQFLDNPLIFMMTGLAAGAVVKLPIRALALLLRATASSLIRSGANDAFWAATFMAMGEGAGGDMSPLGSAALALCSQYSQSSARKLSTALTLRSIGDALWALCDLT